MRRLYSHAPFTFPKKQLEPITSTYKPSWQKWLSNSNVTIKQYDEFSEYFSRKSNYVHQN